MLFVRWIRIRENERGLQFRDGVFERLLAPGRHWVFGRTWKVRIDRASVRDARLRHPDLDLIVKSGALAGQALVLDLADPERALVWVDGRLVSVCLPGLHAFWTVHQDVRHERVDARAVRFEHRELPTILANVAAVAALETVTVDAGHAGLVFRDGRHLETLGPGTYALWRGVGRVRVVPVDLRERVLDVPGQELMTADKVTLRLNALVTYRIVDPLAAHTAVDDAMQAVYREAQLALRAAVGTRELDALLADKDAVASESTERVRARAAPFGVAIEAVGIRDLVLPGEMRTLMNRVTEAKKAAEANLIVRREETAAMRSQANTARILESSPTLMKLRELEVLEKVAGTANLQVVLAESGLAERLTKMI